MEDKPGGIDWSKQKQTAKHHAKEISVGKSMQEYEAKESPVSAFLKKHKTKLTVFGVLLALWVFQSFFRYEYIVPSEGRMIYKVDRLTGSAAMIIHDEERTVVPVRSR